MIELNVWMISGIIFVTQIFFIYFRTLNMIHTADKDWKKAILSGWGVGITWLVTISLGVTAMINLQWQPVMAFLIAGAIGTYIGIITTK